MKLTQITPDLWPAILTLQSEVYHAIEPESPAVMRGKWLTSPEYCVVHRDGDGVGAYLLAHAWHSLQPPKLHTALPPDSHGDILFLHDLAISPRLAGRGVGRRLAGHVLRRAADDGLHTALLVSIQASEGFWVKMGFRSTGAAAGATYGDGARVMSMCLTPFGSRSTV